MMHKGNRPHGLDSAVRVCMKKKLSAALRPVSIILTKPKVSVGAPRIS